MKLLEGTLFDSGCEFRAVRRRAFGPQWNSLTGRDAAAQAYAQAVSAAAGGVPFPDLGVGTTPGHNDRVPARREGGASGKVRWSCRDCQKRQRQAAGARGPVPAAARRARRWSSLGDMSHSLRSLPGASGPSVGSMPSTSPIFNLWTPYGGSSSTARIDTRELGGEVDRSRAGSSARRVAAGSVAGRRVLSRAAG